MPRVDVAYPASAHHQLELRDHVELMHVRLGDHGTIQIGAEFREGAQLYYYLLPSVRGDLLVRLGRGRA